MPRKKPSAPNRLSAAEQARARWDQWDRQQRQQEQDQQEIVDLLSDDEPAAVPEPPAKRVKTSAKNKKNLLENDKELKRLLEQAEFYVSVAGNVRECRESEWIGKVGRVVIGCEEEGKLEEALEEMEEEFWIYVSTPPKKSFLYFQRFLQRKNETEREFNVSSYGARKLN